MGMHRKTHKKNWAMYLLKEVIYLATKKKKWDFIIRKKRRMDAGGQSPELLNIWGISSVQSLSHVQLFVIPWTAAHQASLFITNSWSLLKLMSIESVMLSNHLILCCPLLLPPSIFPSIRVFFSDSVLHMRWPKYWSFSFNISPSSEIQDWFPLGWTGWISLQSKGLSRVFSNTTVEKHQFFGAQLSLQSNSHFHTRPLEKT